MKETKDDSISCVYGCCGSTLAFSIGCIITSFVLTQFNYAGTHQLGFSFLGGLGWMILFLLSSLSYKWLIERICKKYGHKGCICQRCGVEKHDWDGCICRQCEKVCHDGYQYDSVYDRGQRGGVEDWLLPGPCTTYYYRCRRCGAEWTEDEYL